VAWNIGDRQYPVGLNNLNPSPMHTCIGHTSTGGCRPPPRLGCGARCSRSRPDRRPPRPSGKRRAAGRAIRPRNGPRCQNAQGPRIPAVISRRICLELGQHPGERDEQRRRRRRDPVRLATYTSRSGKSRTLRVKDRAHSRHGEVGRHVLGVVPHEGYAASDTEASQGEPAGGMLTGSACRCGAGASWSGSDLAAPCTDVPYFTSVARDSGQSCIVLRMA
jgi:hypothetical protein